MEFQDKVLTCADCGAEFVFTAGEQAFFRERQFKNLPKRCRGCKEKRPARGEGRASTKQETAAVCAGCGKETTLPFRPVQGRPVFCRECFKQKKSGSPSLR
jgi:CxxC-x17-CxxC domain-containing protein